jgi:hypothetical protein
MSLGASNNNRPGSGLWGGFLLQRHSGFDGPACILHVLPNELVVTEPIGDQDFACHA